MPDKRLRASFNFFRPFFRLGVGLAYDFKAVPFECGEGPYLVLCTHTNTYDIFFVPLSIKVPLRFVASEHVLRKPFLSWVVRTFVNPIVKQKGVKDLSTVRGILKNLRDGDSVALFPEGNTNHRGETLFFSEAIGKLAKSAKVDVLLYRITNGYLSTPRWGDKARRGPFKGAVEHVITKQECETLSAGELYEIIKQHLYQNPTPIEPRATVPFKGKNLAEHLERAYFICPVCKRMVTIKSKGDEVFCTECSFRARIDEMGYISSEQVPFVTLNEWDDIQRAHVASLPVPPNTEIIFRDEGERGYKIDVGRDEKLIGQGTLILYSDRLEFVHEGGKLCIPLSDMSGVDYVDKQTLQVSVGDDFYEFKNKAPRSALKYVYLMNYLSQKLKGDFNGFFGF